VQNGTLQRLEDDQMDFVKKWLPLLFILFILVAFYQLNLSDYFTFDSLRAHHRWLHEIRNEHNVLTPVLYALVYIIAVAACIPAALFLTLIGGFLFGPALGTFLVVFSATLGGTIIFLAVKNSLTPWFEERAGKWLAQMEKGFQENAFFYLLTLRLIPLFPFWLVNIIPALLDVRLVIFLWATVLGVIPAAFIYTSIGHSLDLILEMNQTPSPQIIFRVDILVPLLGLAILSLLPVLYRYFNKRKYVNKRNSA
jgi:uncharacterized membrane protein YdjX (TVP38/TMEM64 family)